MFKGFNSKIYTYIILDYILFGLIFKPFMTRIEPMVEWGKSYQLNQKQQNWLYTHRKFWQAEVATDIESELYGKVVTRGVQLQTL